MQLTMDTVQTPDHSIKLPVLTHPRRHTLIQEMEQLAECFALHKKGVSSNE